MLFSLFISTFRRGQKWKKDRIANSLVSLEFIFGNYILKYFYQMQE